MGAVRRTHCKIGGYCFHKGMKRGKVLFPAGRSLESFLEEMTSKPGFDYGLDLSIKDRRGHVWRDH